MIENSNVSNIETYEAVIEYSCTNSVDFIQLV